MGTASHQTSHGPFGSICPQRLTPFSSLESHIPRGWRLKAATPRGYSATRPRLIQRLTLASTAGQGEGYRAEAGLAPSSEALIGLGASWRCPFRSRPAVQPVGDLSFGPSLIARTPAAWFWFKTSQYSPLLVRKEGLNNLPHGSVWTAQALAGLEMLLHRVHRIQGAPRFDSSQWC
ncbi:uncharacterized protein JN550_002285 [Neoarthrinium moseri]|uniref:uncharacterized protein n=1 Tax=Neoarthrinium moseri TaxID=1658444 RepID=UPI001FDD817C|nr:uncharacterized protein JN550_002285 [Neoarthrinium moseri]KAI1874856.1 hypothetical protein JN550_002285 [Neoarthrinium moseri]